MNSIERFNHDIFGTIRTIEADGKVMFCGRDVAAALGYTNTNKAIQDHCKGVPFRYPLPTSGGVQDVRFITEGDLYRLIASSKLPSAQQFEAWVFDEVLPSIRKRGGYLTPEAAEQALTDPDFIIRLATELKTERAQRAQLEAQVEADKPKVVFADAVAASHTTILIGDLAKLLKQNGVEIGAQRLFAHLRRDGYLINRKGADWNSPTQYAMELGLFTVKETAITHSDGHVSISKTTKVTGRGQRYFVERFLDGRLPKPFTEEVAA